MSRIAKAPVELPQGTEFRQDGNVVTIKGSKGTLSHQLNSEVELAHEDGVLKLSPRSGSRFATAVTGTTRSLLANMVTGVNEGFERKLELVGGRDAAGWKAGRIQVRAPQAKRRSALEFRSWFRDWPDRKSVNGQRVSFSFFFSPRCQVPRQLFRSG